MKKIVFFIKDFEDYMEEILSFSPKEEPAVLSEYIKPYMIENLFSSQHILIESIQESIKNDFSQHPLLLIDLVSNESIRDSLCIKEGECIDLDTASLYIYSNFMDLLNKGKESLYDFFISDKDLEEHIQLVLNYTTSAVKELRFLPLDSEIYSYSDEHILTNYYVSIKSDSFLSFIEENNAAFYSLISPYKEELINIFNNTKFAIPFYFIYK